jgi:putative membrane protein
MMWDWSGGMHWWGWLLGAVGMVAFWGLLIWAVWYFVTGVSRRPEQGQGPGEANRILDERLARGEISPEEYRHLRELIRNDDLHAGNGQTPVGTGGQR